MCVKVADGQRLGLTRDAKRLHRSRLGCKKPKADRIGVIEKTDLQIALRRDRVQILFVGRIHWCAHATGAKVMCVASAMARVWLITELVFRCEE